MKIIFVLIIFVLAALLTGFFWMIGLGVLSHIFHEPRLAIGYWQSVLVALVVNLLLGGFSRSSK